MLLAEKVLTGVACYRQFREDDNLYSHAFGTYYHLLYLRNIIIAVAHLDGWDAGCYLNISVIVHSLRY